MVDTHPGDTERLMDYWAHGEGAAKIRWGEPGDFDRCVVEVGSEVPPDIDVKGLCSNLHVRATGFRPGKAPSEQESATSRGAAVQLLERATLTTPVDAKTGRGMVQIIAPGWGNRYYSKGVLAEAAAKGVFKSGTRMYLDHASESEKVDRPERSVKDIAAVLTEGAWVNAVGALVAPIQVVTQYRESLAELSDLGVIGCSISANGEVGFGEAEGRSGDIVESIEECNSVDFVTTPAAGGKILMLESDRVSLAEAVSDKPWGQFSDADYTDAQYAKACVLDRGTGSAKERYGLRVREPDGTLNRNGVHAAAQRVGGVKGASAEQIAAAKSKLRSLYAQLKEEPPDSIKESALTVAFTGTVEPFVEAMAAAGYAVTAVEAKAGQTVQIKSGPNKGKTGKVTKVMPNGTLLVDIDGKPTFVAASALGESDVPVSPAGQATTESQSHKEDEMATKTIEESEYSRLSEDAGRVPKLEQELSEAKTERDTAKAELAAFKRADAARKVVSEAAAKAEIDLDPLQVAGLVAQATADDKGGLDEAAFTKTVDAALADVAKRRSSGGVHGFGPLGESGDFKVTDDILDKLDEAAFGPIARQEA